jgi:hypothetical protein
VSTTLTRPRDRQPTVGAPRFVGNGQRRRPVVAIASLVLVIFCVAVFTSIYVHAGNKVAVLALARDIPQGHAISRGDLAVVKISFSPGLTPIPVGELHNVIGRAAAVSLVRGTLLSSTELTALRGPPRGQAVVGVATKTGQLPAGGVTVGDTVDVILTGSPATLTGGAPDGSTTASSASGGEVEIGGVLAPNATVTGVAAPTESSADTTVVSVLIPSSMAPLVASASASGQAALVLVGSGS